MRIIKQMNGDCITPVSAFLRIRGKNKCLLESVSKKETSNSYSLIAFDPVAELRYHNGLFSVSYRQTGECRTYPCSDPLKEVETYVLKNSCPEEKILFQGGAIGYVGYDVAACYEEIGQVSHNEFDILAETAGCVMAIQHRTLPIVGLQFHPESIGTEQGQYFIDQFLALVQKTKEGTAHAANI